ncbi:uncharacterized protein FIBRA_06139 [Fibroporia radiculosa]|uniref:Cyclin N-terminal domain-containing protein n=1 Tax=Fibroporia radiculosa TaxID=599839 RepID=J4GAQ4_9APHY|nr:uncharacterized protein FIBRA_06139 [Fibroporia radiculosa]CCM03983.1 predicted protein [Fibroporia radiculosa]
MSSSSIMVVDELDYYSQDTLLLWMLGSPVNWGFVDYMLDYIVVAVQRSRMRPNHRLKDVFFTNTVKNIVEKSQVEMRMLLVALTYVDRACENITGDGDEWVCEQLFIGALMLADKYTNDQNVNIRAWLSWVSVMRQCDLVRIERNFLKLLNYDLHIQDSDLLRHFKPVYALCIKNEGYSQSFFERQESSKVSSSISELPPSRRAIQRPTAVRAPVAMRIPQRSCGFHGCDGTCPSSQSSPSSPMVATPPDNSLLSLALPGSYRSQRAQTRNLRAFRPYEMADRSRKTTPGWRSAGASDASSFYVKYNPTTIFPPPQGSLPRYNYASSSRRPWALYS